MQPHRRPAAAAVIVAVLTGSCAATVTDDTTVATPSEETTMAADPPGGTSPRPTPPGLELSSPRATPPATPADTGGPPIGTDAALFPGEIDPGLVPFVRSASEDLADRLGIPTDAIEAVSALLVTWPDTSIGCPQPGMSYALVAQDGSLIELEHAGRVYRYHTGGERTAPFLCDPPPDTRPTPVG